MSPRAVRAAIALAALTTAAATVGGCLAGAGSDAPVVDVMPRPKGQDTVVFPLDYVLPTEAENRVTTQAVDILVRACLRQYGFAFDKPVIGTGSDLVPRLPRRVNDGFVTEEQARTYGFHPAREDGTRQEETAELPPEGPVVDVLHGWGKDGGATSGTQAPRRSHRGRPIPEHGCLGEAEKTLSKGAWRPVPGTSPGGTRDTVNYVVRLRKQAAERARHDRRVKDVTAKWAACYAKKTGDSAESPAALAQQPRWRSTDKPSEAEISAAVASSQCQLQVGYPRVVDSVTAAYEELIAEANRPTLSNVATFFRARTKNATAIVRGGSAAAR